MQSSFTPDEQQLINKLKEKYSGAKSFDASAQDDTSCTACVASSRTSQEPASGGRPRQVTDVEASLCAECGGTGTKVEIYNHRRLENYCSACEGRGVRVFKNGKQVRDGAAGASPATSGAAAGPAGVVALQRARAARNDDGSDAGEPDSPAERIEALRGELQRIAAKAAAYTKERLDALAVLQQPARGTDPAGRDAAARDLVAQLDLQLERLELARRKKQATLDRVQQRAAGVSLDDIIAHEAPRAR